MNMNSNTILIVDNSEFFLMLISALFDKRECSILMSRNAIDALEIINREKPTIIIADQYLPDLSGDEFCREIRENSASKDSAIIILSTSDRDDDREKCFAADCDEFIAKPVDREELLGIVTKYLPIIARQHRRWQTYIPANFYYNGKEYHATVHCISEGGTFIVGEKDLQAKDELNLKLKFPGHDRTIEVKGKVVWNFKNKDKFPEALKTVHGMGIQFTSLPREDCDAIASYVKNETNKMASESTL